MNKIKLKHIINAAIIIWLVIWIYYLGFNWDVFSINLKTDLGFAVIGAYPFIFFSVLGIVLMALIKYVEQTMAMKSLGRDKDMEHKIALLEKDIELLRLKETLFKMQSEDLSRNNANLNALHQRLDEITSQLGQEEKKSDNSSSSPHDEKKE
ncbi:MAG: hypothetical protein U5K32_10885 [Bacteroidales bacterium]|nr:hypothetical protein [Bacteroidales bacterium]